MINADIEIILALVLLVGTLISFILEKVSVDMTAITLLGIILFLSSLSCQTNGGFLISIPKNQNIKLQKDMELNKNIWEIGEINSKYNEKINII